MVWAKPQLRRKLAMTLTPLVEGPHGVCGTVHSRGWMVGRNSQGVTVVGQVRVREVRDRWAVEVSNFRALIGISHDCLPAGGHGGARLEHSLVDIAIVVPSPRPSTTYLS